MAVDIVRGVSTELTEKDLTSSLRETTVAVKQVRHLGVSETVKLTFEAETAPELTV